MHEGIYRLVEEPLLSGPGAHTAIGEHEQHGRMPNEAPEDDLHRVIQKLCRWLHLAGNAQKDATQPGRIFPDSGQQCCSARLGTYRARLQKQLEERYGRASLQKSSYLHADNLELNLRRQ